jgi:hypothetical protein
MECGQVEEMAALLSEEVIVDLSRRKLDLEVLNGRDAAISFAKTWLQLWGSHKLELERIAAPVPIGTDRFLGILSGRCRRPTLR